MQMLNYDADAHYTPIATSMNLDKLLVNSKLSGDGSVRVVGISGLDTKNKDVSFVYVFREGQLEKKLQYKKYFDLTNHHDDISISEDGNTIALGRVIGGMIADTVKGSVSIITYSNGLWTNKTRISLEEDIHYDKFGYCLTLSSDGNWLAVSYMTENYIKPDRKNKVNIYHRLTNKWEHITTIDDESNTTIDFGKSLAISRNGTRLFIGANKYISKSKYKIGLVNVYDRVDNSYSKSMTFGVDYDIYGNGFGDSIDTTDNGRYIVIGCPMKLSSDIEIDTNIYSKSNLFGRVYSYVYNANEKEWEEWLSTFYLNSINPIENDGYGKVAKISSSGDRLFVLSDKGCYGKDINCLITELYSKQGNRWLLFNRQQLYTTEINTNVFISLSGDGCTTSSLCIDSDLDINTMIETFTDKSVDYISLSL